MSSFCQLDLFSVERDVDHIRHELPQDEGGARYRAGYLPVSDFQDAYRERVARMKALAEADGDVFLPNLEPSGPVDYVFICMEPSRGKWALTPEKARAEVAKGFRNFLPSGDVAILHFAAHEFLPAGTRYYMTDLSKGAMFGKYANIGRTQRYNRWSDLLMEELALVAAPGAKIFAVGGVVKSQLERRGLRPSATLMHYSSVAASHRSRAIVGREDSFEQFKRSVSIERLQAVAGDVLATYDVPPCIRAKALAQLVKRKLTDSLLKLAFSYKVAIEEAQERQAERKARMEESNRRMQEIMEPVALSLTAHPAEVDHD
jgi:hypothetical protein